MLIEISIDDQKVYEISEIYSEISDETKMDFKSTLIKAIKQNLNKNVDVFLDRILDNCRLHRQKVNELKKSSSDEIGAILDEQFDKLKANDL